MREFLNQTGTVRGEKDIVLVLFYAIFSKRCPSLWRWLFSLGLQIKGSSSFWYLLTHGERFQPTRALIKHWTQLASNTNDCNSESESRKWKLDYPLLLRHLWTPPCWAKAPRLANLPTCLVALTFRAETPPIDDDCWLLFVCWTPPPWLPLLDAPSMEKI